MIPPCAAPAGEVARTTPPPGGPDTGAMAGVLPDGGPPTLVEEGPASVPCGGGVRGRVARAVVLG
ncbi:hypothetical protein FH608_027325 [Nonomuraea phyllanthi]|uniref:Uncharacterized protein n=1 Tax=Nonomuraea phyllanthi TaxID=2219224 RepID=A0A5C4W904_9ACTN|nr:hypothetical protein [Nonomuraea phyllanthi]KAB8192374.1 hypothetical protein FH608_027325 [Nonomuraea phyllanthi]